MGCAASSPTATTSHQTSHGYNNQRNATNNTNTTTTTTYNTNTNTQTNTTGGKVTYPDDNAIYGYDLYGDDDQKKAGGSETKTQQDTSDDKPKENTNQMQYDDAGFYGETNKEKEEQELFIGDGQEKQQSKETDDTVPPAPEQEVTTETKTEEGTDVPPPETTEDVTTETNVKTEESTDVTPPTPGEVDTKEDNEVIPPPPAENDVVPEAPSSDDVQKTEPEQTEPEQTEAPAQEETDIPVPPPALDTVVQERKDTLRNDLNNDGDYTRNSTGLMAMYLDCRTSHHEDQDQKRPQVSAGVLWTDHSFGLYDAITDSSVSSNLAWKRPSEICSCPKLFSDGTTRYDIGQGGAGTCWFLSTVANISEKPELLKQVIPDDAYPVGTDAYNGVFHARFWKFGQWEDVYIDDYLPIIHDTIPWGARSATDENEFWVSLLEKSFARYHGSYTSVYGGQPGDAYLALTGGVAERIDFEDNEHKPRKLFERVRNAINSGALVTCTVPGEYDNVYGLVGDHAYSVTGTAKVRGESLLRVRNPWGKTEWTGAWSDGSAEWTSYVKDELSQVNKDDGEFWICLKDFLTYFSQTTICSLTPDFDMDGRSDSLNYVTNVYGEWKGETAAGFQNKLTNPRYLFTVPESETDAAVVVQLVQRREDRQDENFQVRCDLYKVLCDDGGVAVLEIMGENTNSYCPETQCSFRHRVTPGTYAAVPSAVEAGQEKSYLIRIFSSCPLQNVREMSRCHKLMSCEQETSFIHDEERYPLRHCQTLLGAWRAGVNAGGQISYRNTHASNPQFVLSVHETTPVVIHIVQEHCDPRMPVGLRLYPTGDAPMNIDQIYDLYDEAVTDTDGTNSKFIQGWDVKTAYVLRPGQYTLLIHMDEPNSEKRYAVVVKSPHPVDVRGCQTGA